MLKVFLRDILPSKVQVPVKYWVNRIGRTLEPELGLLEFLVKPGEKAIDVGANRGVYTYVLWRLQANVSAFEPNRACSRVLEAWATSRDRLSVYCIALSDRSGTAALRVPVDAQGVEHDASASLEHDGFGAAHAVQVELQTLDSFGMQGVGFIKIDVEGHELSVIEGASATIRESSPSLLIEIEHRHNPLGVRHIAELLKSWGYRGYFLDGGRLRDVVEFDPQRDQLVSNLGVRGARYINNFLFLASARIASGQYHALLHGQRSA